MILGQAAPTSALVASLVASRGHCVTLNSPVLKVPDPLIYDQYHLMSRGVAVTWDNPDIKLHRLGVIVSPSNLEANTDYMIVATIRNSSKEAPAVHMKVWFSYLSFGVGTVSHPIGSLPIEVNLGVLGGPHMPKFVPMPWTTPATPGHYCIQVRLEPFDDSNWFNNLGQNNTQVGKAHSSAVFTFALRNNATERRQYDFRADAYVLGEPPPCPPADVTIQPTTALAPTPIVIPPIHKQGAQPLPSGWDVELAPQNPTLNGGEETTITVTIKPPVSFTGKQAVNVNAFARGDGAKKASFAGGVTFIVEK